MEEQDKINKLTELFILYSNHKLLNRTLKRMINENWAKVLNSWLIDFPINQFKKKYSDTPQYYTAIFQFYSCLNRFDIPLSFKEFCNRYNIKFTSYNYDFNYNIKESENLVNLILNYNNIPTISKTIDLWQQEKDKKNKRINDNFIRIESEFYYDIFEKPFIYKSPVKFNVRHIKDNKNSNSKDKNKDWRKQLYNNYKSKSEIKLAKDLKTNNKTKNIYLSIDNNTINNYIDNINYDNEYLINTIIQIEPEIYTWTIVAQRKVNFIILNPNVNFNLAAVYAWNLKYNNFTIISPIRNNYETIAKQAKTRLYEFDNIYPIIGRIKSINKEDYGYFIQSIVYNESIPDIDLFIDDIKIDLKYYPIDKPNANNYVYINNIDIPRIYPKRTLSSIKAKIIDSINLNNLD